MSQISILRFQFQINNQVLDIFISISYCILRLSTFETKLNLWMPMELSLFQAIPLWETKKDFRSSRPTIPTSDTVSKFSWFFPCEVLLQLSFLLVWICPPPPKVHGLKVLLTSWWALRKWLDSGSSEFWPNQWIKPLMNSEYDCITGREDLTEGNKPQGHALERSVCSYPLSVGLCLFVSGDPWGKQLCSTTPPLLPCSTSPQAYGNGAKQLWTSCESNQMFLPLTAWCIITGIENLLDTP